MPVKVGKGGHGHENYDPSTGKYVEGGGKSSSFGDIREKSESLKSVSLKPDANLEEILKKIQARKEAQKTGMPVSLADAEVQINRTLGRDVCTYAPDTSIEAAHEANKGFKDVYNDFSRAFDSLLKYGTGAFVGKDEGLKKYREIDDLLIKEVEKRFDTISQSTQAGYVIPDIIKASFISSMRNNFKQSVDNIVKKVIYDRDTLGMWFSSQTGIRGENVSITVGSISFNQDWFRMNVKQGDDYVRPSVSARIHFDTEGGKSFFYATATHELGHLVDYFLSDYTDQNAIKSIFKRRNDLLFANQITGYAASEKVEMVAEAFSDWYSRGEKATETNKKIFKIYKDAYDKHFGNKKAGT